MKRRKSRFGRRKLQLGLDKLVSKLPELPFSMEKAHLLVFVVVFFVALFIYDQSMPSVRVSTGAPLVVGSNPEAPAAPNTSHVQNQTEFVYPEPNGTTEVPLEINYTGGDALVNDTTANETAVNSTINENNTDETGEGPEEEPEAEEEPEETPQEPEEPEAPEEPEEAPEESEPPEEPRGNAEVTYYFFWAEYCSTCKTMMPWIREVGRDHPSLNVEMVDLTSGSPYINRFAVSSTAVSVIIKRIDGEDVSGTKMIGFMDQDGIERLACSELDDAICDRRYPKA